MLLPWGTDAPIYHWPVATAGLIVANIAIFAGEATGTVDADAWSLALGHGIHPLQWISHAFLHGGLVHLIGNMIFLWVFGLIVEGKIGALPFLAVYALMCVLDGVVTQTIMLHKTPPGSLLGASGAIFGLMAIAMVWAPKNDVYCHVLIGLGFRVSTWDAPVYLLAILYIGLEALQVAVAGLLGDALMQALIHLPGAIWGFLIGTIMVKLNWVDCEGWDMYALLDRRRRFGQEWKQRGERLDRQKKVKPRARHVKKKAQTDLSSEERAANASQKLRERLAASDFDGARSTFDKYARTLAGWPSEGVLLDIIKNLHSRKEMVASVPYMQAYCQRFPNQADRVRLKLAQVLIRDRQRPTHGLRVLEEVPESALAPDLKPLRRRLEELARQMQEDGVLELEEDYG